MNTCSQELGLSRWTPHFEPMQHETQAVNRGLKGIPTTQVLTDGHVFRLTATSAFRHHSPKSDRHRPRLRPSEQGFHRQCMLQVKLTADIRAGKRQECV